MVRPGAAKSAPHRPSPSTFSDLPRREVQPGAQLLRISVRPRRSSEVGRSRNWQARLPYTLIPAVITWGCLVGLMKRYSKPVYQGRRLRRMVEMAEKSANMRVSALAPLPQTQRVDRRLSAEAIAEMV